MKKSRWFVLIFLLMASAAFAKDQPWRPADGPLKTRWTRDVSPGRVWTEYPRPQMARPEWLNLNGLWDYAITETNNPDFGQYEGKILVPFPIESSLSGVMRRLDEKHFLFYRRSFEMPKGWEGRRILLHFGAVDWQARVTVDGVELGTHRGGYDPFTFDITKALQPAGKHEIRLEVFDPTDKGGQPRGKQVTDPNGIWYTPTSGIWQTVWLEPVSDASVDDLTITPDVDHAALHVSGRLRGGTGDEVLEFVASAHGHEVGRVSGPAGSELQIPIAHAQLWSPDRPYLYDLKVTVLYGQQRVDSVRSYFAMRKISLGKDAKGVTRLMLNNQPLFQMGPLDQGFWPDGIYTAPTDQAMRYDLEMTKKLGFNMIRKHVKVEPDRWYYDCDKLGLVVWQDMPGAFMGNRSEAQDKQFEEELRQMILTHRNHPCIVLWVLFNEGWGEYDTVRLTHFIKDLDPSRLVDDASGWTDKKAGDLVDKHHYPTPVRPELEENRTCVQGEFGGLGLPIDGHTWTKKSWGYKGMANRKELTQRYVDLIKQVLQLKQSAGLSAAVYTQTTDVETECNGLMTYDREILKPDLSAVRAANEKLYGE